MDQNNDTHDAADREDFKRLAAELHEGLRQQRCHSIAIFHNGRRLIVIRDRRLWGLAGAPSCEAWIDDTYGIGERQARKYFRIGEVLSAEFCEGLSLDINSLYQIAQAPVELRDTLKDVGQQEGLPPGALRQGWHAGARLLAVRASPGELADPNGYSRKETETQAREETAQVARTWAEQNEDEPKLRKHRGPVTLPSLLGSATRDLGRVVKQLARTWPSPDQVPEEDAWALLAAIDLATPRLRQLVAGSALDEDEEVAAANVVAPPLKTAPASKTVQAAPAPQAAPPPPLQDPLPCATAVPSPQKTTPPPSFTPLIAAIHRELDRGEQDRIEKDLQFIVRGDPPDPHLSSLRRIFPFLVRGSDPVPRVLLEQWIERLGHPDPDRRGSFALWFHERSRLRGFGSCLRALWTSPLTPLMRSKVEEASQRTLPTRTNPPPAEDSPIALRSRLILPLDVLASLRPGQ